ncbi:hydrogenase maturation protein [Dechloromonas sp.]|uniref:hydrogenase maturation protein n=1 Tax=Dechloromonas sp. TaxID=1917218 RepID=UPI00122AF20D|nr:hydrogenase maturation protein [Dechloromonas sp.]MBU3697962.1 hydrogenase maturation protein [Dechloromonas sp.]TEX49384.1 MAG: hydrogenase maturation protein [Rhodocyclaceae bacterium]
MRILFITHSFNSLTQRLYCELSALGHEISVEFDIADAVTDEAVARFVPDLIVAPFLKRAIPASIWSRHVCMIVHPGIAGDRGPSSLDWAIQSGLPEWGVTVLQAEAEMDAGPVWAEARFPLRRGRKASVYRHEVTEAAVIAVKQSVARFVAGDFTPQRVAGQALPLMKQPDRVIDWSANSSASILARLNAADGFPGVADSLFGEACHLFDAWPEATLRGDPGSLLGRRETAILRATVDGAVWIGHVKRPGGIKLPATLAFPEAASLPELPLDAYWKAPAATWQDIAYEEAAGVGFLSFEFYNGAMSTAQCRRLTAAFRWACERPTRVIVLLGGLDFWSNGIHLNTIEAAESPANASWENINAIDDLAEAILRCNSRLTVAALGGNAGAGGCFLARAADVVWVRDGVMLNPHYKNMGNLYGSEFWTYLLPPRVGEQGARDIMRHRLPMSALESVRCGFYDACLPAPGFAVDVARRAAELAAAPDIEARIAAKAARRAADEATKPLAEYRAAELAEMRRNFYGFDPSYHVARYHFVARSPHSWTPRHLARHRDLDWKIPA